MTNVSLQHGTTWPVLLSLLIRHWRGKLERNHGKRYTPTHIVEWLPFKTFLWESLGLQKNYCAFSVWNANLRGGGVELSISGKFYNLWLLLWISTVLLPQGSLPTLLCSDKNSLAVVPKSGPQHLRYTFMPLALPITNAVHLIPTIYRTISILKTIKDEIEIQGVHL